MQIVPLKACSNLSCSHTICGGRAPTEHPLMAHCLRTSLIWWDLFSCCGCVHRFTCSARSILQLLSSRLCDFSFVHNCRAACPDLSHWVQDNCTVSPQKCLLKEDSKQLGSDIAIVCWEIGHSKMKVVMSGVPLDSKCLRVLIKMRDCVYCTEFCSRSSGSMCRRTSSSLEFHLRSRNPPISKRPCSCECKSIASSIKSAPVSLSLSLQPLLQPEETPWRDQMHSSWHTCWTQRKKLAKCYMCHTIVLEGVTGEACPNEAVQVFVCIGEGDSTIHSDDSATRCCWKCSRTSSKEECTVGQGVVQRYSTWQLGRSIKNCLIVVLELFLTTCIGK